MNRGSFKRLTALMLCMALVMSMLGTALAESQTTYPQSCIHTISFVEKESTGQGIGTVENNGKGINYAFIFEIL